MTREYSKIILEKKGKNSSSYFYMPPESIFWLNGWNRYMKNGISRDIDPDDRDKLQKILKSEINNVFITQFDFDLLEKEGGNKLSFFNTWVREQNIDDLVLVTNHPEIFLLELGGKEIVFSNIIILGGALSPSFFDEITKKRIWSGYAGNINHIRSRDLNLLDNEKICETLKKYLRLGSNGSGIKIGLFVDFSYLEELHCQRKVMPFNENLKISGVNILEREVYPSIKTDKLICIIDFFYKLFYLNLSLSGKDYKFSVLLENGRLQEKFSRQHLWRIFYELDNALSS